MFSLACLQSMTYKATRWNLIKLKSPSFSPLLKTLPLCLGYNPDFFRTSARHCMTWTRPPLWLHLTGPVLLAPSLSLEPTKNILILGLLHLLFPLPGTFFPHIFLWLPPARCSSLCSNVLSPKKPSLIRSKRALSPPSNLLSCFSFLHSSHSC